MWVGIVVYASMLINHLTTSFHASLFCLAFIITRILAERRIDWKTIMVFIGGFFLSLLFFIPALADHWWLTATKGPAGGIGGIEKLFPFIRFVTTPFGLVTVLMALTMGFFVYRNRNLWQPSVEGWLDAGHRGLMIWLGILALILDRKSVV